MFTDLGDLPVAVWRRVLIWTTLVTAGLILACVIIAWSIATLDGRSFGPNFLTLSIVLPLLVGGPMIFMHLLRLSQLRLANQTLQVLASTDWLTACLNRRAFTHAVTDELDNSGAFLVVDADHFKFINDRFGHDQGDEVLQLIASTIKASVREDDLVGRLGGEEFGVFLSGTNLEQAKVVGERICSAVSAAHFAPNGRPYRLSVSVGGACFESGISFSELFRIADQRLYGVKQSGRDRADVTHAAHFQAANVEMPTALAG